MTVKAEYINELERRHGASSEIDELRRRYAPERDAFSAGTINISPEIAAKKTTSFILQQELGLDDNTIAATYSTIVESVYGEALNPTQVLKRMQDDGFLANPQADDEDIRIISEAVIANTAPPQALLERRERQRLTKQIANVFTTLYNQEEDELFSGPTVFAGKMLDLPDLPDTIFSEIPHNDEDLLDIDSYKGLLEQAGSQQQADEFRKERKAVITRLYQQTITEQRNNYIAKEMGKFTTGSKPKDVLIEAYRGLYSALNTISRGTMATSVAVGMAWNQPGVDEIDESLFSGNMTPIEASGKIGYVVRAVSEAIPSFGYNMTVGGSGIFTVEYGNAYQDAINNNASPAQAEAIAIPVATINTIIESMQIDRILKFGAGFKGGKQALKKMVKDGAWKVFIKSGAKFTGRSIKLGINEGIEGALQQGVSIAVPGMIIDVYPKDENGNIDWVEVGSQMGQSFVGEGLGGLFLGVSSGVYNARNFHNHKLTIAGQLITHEGIPENQALSVATKIVDRLRTQDGDPREIYREEVGQVKMADNRHKAAAHIIQKAKGIPDEQYRRIAEETTGKRSLVDMNYEEAERFIDILRTTVAEEVEPVEGEEAPVEPTETEARAEVVKIRDAPEPEISPVEVAPEAEVPTEVAEVPPKAVTGEVGVKKIEGKTLQEVAAPLIEKQNKLWKEIRAIAGKKLKRATDNSLVIRGTVSKTKGGKALLKQYDAFTAQITKLEEDFAIAPTPTEVTEVVEPQKQAEPIEKEIKHEKEAIIEPATSLEVERRETEKFVPTGKLDPTDQKEAAEIIELHQNFIAGDKSRVSIGGIYETEWDKEKGESVISGVEYTSKQIDTAYRAIQKPIPSPMPDTELFAMPGKEAALQAIAQKMQKVKGVSIKKKGVRVSKPLALPKAKTKKEDHIKAVYKAAAAESTRYALNGVFVEGENIVATDGRRMFMAKGKWGKDGIYLDKASLAKGLLGKVEKEGIFPKWQDIVPLVHKSDAIIVDDLDTVWRRVKQASLLSSVDSPGLTVLINKDGSLGFASTSPEIGHTEINIYPGAKILGGLNPQFLLDSIAFHAIRGDTAFEFYFEHWERPVLTRSSNRKTSTVIMPINIEMEPSDAIKEAITPLRKKGLRPGFVDNTPFGDESILQAKVNAILASSVPLPPKKPQTEPEKKKTLKELKKTQKLEAVKVAAKGLVRGIDRTFGLMSTRIKNISLALFQDIRNKVINPTLLLVEERTRAVHPFVDGINNKLGDEDRYDFEVAQWQSDEAEVTRIIVKNDLVKEYQDYRKILDQVYHEANAVGMDVDYRQAYFPSAVKDFDGLLKELNIQEEYAPIVLAMQQAQDKKGRPLNRDEQLKLIDTLLRGYRVAGLTLSRPGFAKERTLIRNDIGLIKYYHGFEESTSRYIESMTENIQQRKFFGKTTTELVKLRASISRLQTRIAKLEDGRTKVKNPKTSITKAKRRLATLKQELEAKDNQVLENSVATHVLDLIEAGEIRYDQQLELTQILDGLFKDTTSSKWIHTLRSLEYAGSLAQVPAMVTQYSEIVLSILKAPGTTLPAFVRANLGKSKIKLRDIGVAHIGQEWVDADLDKTVTALLKPFELADRVGKEAFINSVVEKYRKMAKTNPEKAREELRKYYPEEGIDSVTESLLSGKIDNNVKGFALNELADVQPISKFEVPELYAKAGNFRVFYMYKTFVLKRLDIIRNQAYNQIKSGIKNGNNRELAKGLAKLVWLAFMFSLADASADVVKDIIRGKPLETLDNYIVDALLQMVMLNKYTVSKSKKEGPSVFFRNNITLPVSNLDAAFKDIMILMDEDSERGSELARRIPWIGEMYFWYMGEGARKVEEGVYDE